MSININFINSVSNNDQVVFVWTDGNKVYYTDASGQTLYVYDYSTTPPTTTQYSFINSLYIYGIVGGIAPNSGYIYLIAENQLHQSYLYYFDGTKFNDITPSISNFNYASGICAYTANKILILYGRTTIYLLEYDTNLQATSTYILTINLSYTFNGLSYDGNYVWVEGFNNGYNYIYQFQNLSSITNNKPIASNQIPQTIAINVTSIYSDGTYLWVISATSTNYQILVYEVSTFSSAATPYATITNPNFSQSYLMTDISFYNGNNNFWIGNGTNISNFSVIYPVPCIPKGQKVLTPSGYQLVETLKDGDCILTPDQRDVPIKVYSTVIKKSTHKNAPYLIPADTFSENLPVSDIILSPSHAIQVDENLWQIPCKAIKHYQNIKMINLGKEIEYYHLETPNYLRDNLVVEGSAVESYGNNYIKKYLSGVKIYSYDPSVKAYRRTTHKKESELLLSN